MNRQRRLCAGLWPNYMSQDPILNKFWHPLFSLFAGFELLLAAEDGIIKLANSLPFTGIEPSTICLRRVGIGLLRRGYGTTKKA